MATETIKEFLVSLGWKVDEAGQRRFVEGVTTAAKSVAALSVALEAAAVAAVGVVHRISAGFEELYYTSSRVNSSATNIRAFQYAISQLGGTADGALSSLEAFSRKLRESPGTEAQLRAWGVQTRDARGKLRDDSELLKEALQSRVFLAQPDYQRLAFAEKALGIDEKTYRAMLLDVERFTKEYRDRMKKAGFDPDKAAEAATKFEQAWRSALLGIEVIKNRVFQNFDDKLQEKFKEFGDYVDTHSKEIANGLIAIGTALGTMLEWLVKAIEKVGEWADAADPWIEKNLGITDGFEKLAAVIAVVALTRIPQLIAAVTGLVALPAIRTLTWLLGALGLGGSALGLGGTALGLGGAWSLVPSPMGQEDELARQRNIAKDPNFYGGGSSGAGAPADTRNFLQRHLPKLLGGKDAPTSTGSVSWRNNNPGNIKYGPFAQAHGATGADSNGFAVFPDEKSGSAAHRALWESAGYANTPFSEALSKWSGGGYGPKEFGLSPTGTFAQLSEEEKSKFLLAQKASEGWSAGATVGSPAGAAGRASTMIGAHESINHSDVQEYLRTGGVGMDPEKSAWCAAYVQASFAKEGFKGAGNVATSWAAWGGPATGKIRAGDVGVMMRGRGVGQTGGHVGIMTGRVRDGYAEEIEGNAGNRVQKVWEPINTLTLRRAMPIGNVNHDNSIRYGHHVNAKTTINVNAAGDPGATARAVAGQQSTVNADLIRNLQGAAH